MNVRFNQLSDGAPILASHLNGYGLILKQLFRDSEYEDSTIRDETLVLDNKASIDYFTGKNLYNIYTTSKPLVTELLDLVLVSSGIRTRIEPEAIDWVTGSIRIEPRESPATLIAAYKYVNQIESLADITSPKLDRLPQPSEYYRGRIVVVDDGTGHDLVYICISWVQGIYKWVDLASLQRNTNNTLGLGTVGSITLT